MNIWYAQYYAYESQFRYGYVHEVTATAATQLILDFRVWSGERLRGFRYGYVHEITAVHIVDSARAMHGRLKFEVWCASNT